MLRKSITLFGLCVIGFGLAAVLYGDNDNTKSQKGVESVEYDTIQEKVVANLEEAWTKTVSKPENKDLDKVVSGERDLVEAIQQAGHMRSVKAVPALVKAITVIAQPETPSATGSVGQMPPPWKLYPAQDALVRIGTPALPSLVARFTGPNQPKVDSVREFDILNIIAAIAGPENGVRLFEKAIKEAKEEADQKSLQSALEKFKKKGGVPQLVEDPSFQMFIGNVSETLAAESKPVPPEEKPTPPADKP